MSAAIAAPSASSPVKEQIEGDFKYLDRLDAILREVYGGQARPAGAPAPIAAVPDNPARFVAEPATAPVAEAAGCCEPAAKASCCEPAAKASCCGTASAGGCGCR